MLEPYDGKLSSTVLRGERGCKAPDLPGMKILIEMKSKNGMNCCENCESRYIPVHMRVPLLIEVGFRCPLLSCSAIDKTKLEIHHIEDWSKSQTHDLNNMIAVCPSCHYSLDRKEISPSAVKKVKIKLTSYYSEFDSLCSEKKPTLFTRLDFEGKYLQLQQTITQVINYCDKRNVYLPFLPELAVEKAKSLRKIETAKQALKFIGKFEERWYRNITTSQRYSLDLARGYVLFNSLEFDSALQYIESYKNAFQEIKPIGSEADLFELYQRLSIIYWNKKKLYTDLDYLHQLSNTKSDKVDILLVQAVVKKKGVSNEWINEVEQILFEVSQPNSSFSLGYERHALAELFYIASRIFESRGQKDSAYRSIRFYDDYFSLAGASKKLKVWEI